MQTTTKTTIKCFLCGNTISIADEIEGYYTTQFICPICGQTYRRVLTPEQLLTVEKTIPIIINEYDNSIIRYGAISKLEKLPVPTTAPTSESISGEEKPKRRGRRPKDKSEFSIVKPLQSGTDEEESID